MAVIISNDIVIRNRQNCDHQECKQFFKEHELDQKSNVQKMHIANVDRLVSFYSLDVIISVGYRANSQREVEFRKWANSILKQFILQGYTGNAYTDALTFPDHYDHRSLRRPEEKEVMTTPVINFFV